MNFGSAAAIGLACGFLWGLGCSLAILYSIFLGGYRKGVEDSLAEVKTDRYRRTLEKIEIGRAEAKARK
jgi:hypothetical protein